MTEESWAKAVSEHEEIIAALEDQDPERLEAILIQHVETKRVTILGALEDKN
jgi:DNA-binding GntR family transcriptional regulator